MGATFSHYQVFPRFKLMSFPNSSSSAPTSSAVGSIPVIAPSEGFVERRTSPPTREASERRQFGSSHSGLSDAGRELALAIDQYKVEHHRRYITCDEMLAVLASLGYGRN